MNDLLLLCVESLVNDHVSTEPLFKMKPCACIRHYQLGRSPYAGHWGRQATRKVHENGDCITPHRPIVHCSKTALRIHTLNGYCERTSQFIKKKEELIVVHLTKFGTLIQALTAAHNFSKYNLLLTFESVKY